MVGFGSSNSPQRPVGHSPDPCASSDERRATSDRILRLAGLVKESVVDGPGLRAVVFVQGCPHRCPGCHNPKTWDPAGGFLMTVEELWDEIKGLRLLRGITYSGGEPFAQAAPLALLAERIKGKGWDLFVYTGYTWEELQRRRTHDPGSDRLLRLADVLVDGPFILAARDPRLPFRGSRNQRLIDLRASEGAGRSVIWEVPAWTD
ncbi:MAG: anaerobic ribonucleoside-triphosphate reductase activating protein [Firmicutes bacterium]|nr:anaerobic ribonucleoside-triphosphate reductase activating protein [Bacillota bacterium]